MPKLSHGAGERTVHSSVVARQGLGSSIFSPRHNVEIKLIRKRTCAATVTIVATVINVRSDALIGVSNLVPNVVANGVLTAIAASGARECAIKPSQCMGMKTQ